MDIMMDLKVVTIDFWGTLYHHRGTPEYRKRVITELLTKFLRTINYDDDLKVAQTFYEVTNKYVESRWESGVAPSREDVINHSYEGYGNRIPKEILNRLLEEVYRMYTDELHPTLTDKGEETLKWLSSQASLYIISDTFTIIGNVLDKILDNDGLIKYFKGRYYSDETGTKKAESDVMRRIAMIEGVAPNQIVHVGDLLETDGALAMKEGTHCIIIGKKDLPQQEILLNPGDNPLFAFCENFSNVKEAFNDMVNR